MERGVAEITGVLNSGGLNLVLGNLGNAKLVAGDLFGGGGAGEFGAIIWQAKLEGALLIADATLAGVGAGALLPFNPSPTIVSNFDSITTDFGSNPKPS